VIHEVRRAGATTLREIAAALNARDVKILSVTLAGMSVEQFQAEEKHWLDTAKNPRWNRPYRDLTYLPMIELLKYMRVCLWSIAVVH
jgi:hypothetical protein